MRYQDVEGWYGARRPTLADLPALRTAVLRLRVQLGPVPVLPPRGAPPVTGLRSLTLEVGSLAKPPVLDMPALTELRMARVGEHRPRDAMLWLAALPELQVCIFHMSSCPGLCSCPLFSCSIKTRSSVMQSCPHMMV